MAHGIVPYTYGISHTRMGRPIRIWAGIRIWGRTNLRREILPSLELSDVSIVFTQLAQVIPVMLICILLTPVAASLLLLCALLFPPSLGPKSKNGNVLFKYAWKYCIFNIKDRLEKIAV